MKAGLKTILLAALGTFAAFSAVTYTSCNNDKCKAIVCAYGGVCKEGECICVPGYEGPQCETKASEKFLGTWTVSEVGTYTRSVQYTINIDQGSSPTEILIRNFYDKLTSPVKANIVGDTIKIPQQTVDSFTVTGRGVITRKYGTYQNHADMTVWYNVKEPNGRTNDFGTTDYYNTKPSSWSK